MSDGGGDGHRRGLALLQGPGVPQGDGLLQFPNLGWVVAALGPLPPPLGRPGLHLQAAAVVLQLLGGLLLRLTEPAQPTLCQRALLGVRAQLETREGRVDAQVGKGGLGGGRDFGCRAA